MDAAGPALSYIPKGLVTDQIKLDYKLDIDGVTPYSKTGKHAVASITAFSDLRLCRQLMENLKSTNHRTPTAIQRHGMPQIKTDSDLMCCSHTGSGKTATYLVPLLNSLCGKRGVPQTKRFVPSVIKTAKESESAGTSKSSGEINVGQSAPAILIMVPTRELAEQVNEMAKVLAKGLNVKSLAVYGGDSMGAELGQLRRNSIDLVVATPGRLFHILEEFKVLTLDKVEYLVIDEADEMFNRGFFGQICDILKIMGPLEERTNIMLSATFPRQIHHYAQKFLRTDYTFVAVGVVGSASPDIRQDVRSADGVEKGAVLLDILDGEDKNKILVFCNTIERVNALTHTLREQPNFTLDSIHSEHSQAERDQALMDFNEGKIQCLIATSVASRGLNITGVHCVVNYDFPKDICEYVQRIGRARTIGEGLPAVAISLFDRELDKEICDDLIFIMEEAKQDVPQFLRDLKEKIRVWEEDYREAFGDEEFDSPFRRDVKLPSCIESGFDVDSWG